MDGPRSATECEAGVSSTVLTAGDGLAILNASPHPPEVSMIVRVAAIAAAVLLGLVAVFQVALVLGAP